MRVLITGAAGFIGSHLADRFVACGGDVCGIDNLLTGARVNFPNPPGQFVIGDITRREAFYSLANAVRPDLVVHCAASYSDPSLWHRDVDTNVAGTINAVNVARHHGARLVYFQTALPPISSYAISKIAGERYIGLASDVPSVTFRLANVYGPRNLSGPIPAFYRRLAAGEACTVVDTRRDMVFVADLVDGVMAALATGVTGRYDMCSGGDYAIEDLYDAVADEMGVDGGPVRAPRAGDDVAAMDLDPEPAARDFCWRPSTPLAQGVGVAVAWYREHGVAQTYTHLQVAS